MSATVQERDTETSHWGVEPVPENLRKLGPLAMAVLWWDLGVGLLVVVAGALLVAPVEAFGFAMSLPSAFASIAIGSLMGSFLLGLGALIGSREARPTMALLRDVLGTKGSWVPTVLNVGQLVGWTAFELWVMALVANGLSEPLFGFSSFGLWLVVFTIAVTALTLWGPIGVIRLWMQRFGAWLVGVIGLIVTIGVLSWDGLGAVFAQSGAGGSMIFGLPLDLVIAMPVSWIPLVADYSRFSKHKAASFLGTTIGYALANFWFYCLGALLVARFADAPVTPEGIALSILSLGGISITGILMLIGLLVGETDEAFADVYSSAVSLRNMFPRTDNRVFVVGVSLVGAFLAARFTMLSYELFLFLLGSIFVPLLGVWFADYFVLSNKVTVRPVRWESFVPWIAGFVLYHWIAPTPLGWWTRVVESTVGTPLSTRADWLGASIPAFMAAFGIQIALVTILRAVAGPRSESVGP